MTQQAITPEPRHREFDVIVVGARVGGAATARLLARRGLRVLLLDRRRPGGDTMSTHALMRGGVLQLARWGVLDRIVAAGTPAIRQTTLHYGDEVDTVPFKPRTGVQALYAPRRTVLDTVLVDAAEEEGVTVRFGVTVTGLVTDETGRVRGVRGRDRSGRAVEYRARVTVGADGVRSVIARHVQSPVLRRGRHASAMVYSYWDGLEADGYEWFYRPGVSAGLIPTNDGLTCAWAGLSSRHCTGDMVRDLDRTFHALVARAAPEARPRFDRARRIGRYVAFPGLPGFQRQPWGPGWALVGDASHFKDPLSTHGITDALRDAEFLARAIDRWLGHGVSERDALGAYHGTRDRLSEELFTATDVVASYDWDPTEVKPLLLALSYAMREEVDALASLDAPALVAA